MSPFQAWRHERNARIFALTSAGVPAREIAEQIPCCLTTVYDVLNGRSGVRGHRQPRPPVKPARLSHPPSADWWLENGRTARLIKLWNEGFTARQIATDLGDTTRNAVIGKAHRLGLAPRPSPIKRTSRLEPMNSLKAASVATESVIA